jgi:zinc protease
MIGGDPQSRLWIRIREKEGLSYAVQSAFNAGLKEKFAQFLAIAICNPQNIQKVETAFKDEMSNILTKGFTDEEVAKTKKTFLEDRQVGRSQDAGLLRVLQRNAQYGWTMTRDADLETKIASLSAADINAAVKRHLSVDSISIFKAGDFKKAGITQ